MSTIDPAKVRDVAAYLRGLNDFQMERAYVEHAATMLDWICDGGQGITPGPPLRPGQVVGPFESFVVTGCTFSNEPACITLGRNPAFDWPSATEPGFSATLPIDPSARDVTQS